MSSVKVIVVKADGCPHCEDFVKDLDKPGVSDAIKKELGASSIEVVDVTKDSLAENIVSSLNNYEVPLIATLKETEGRREVCELNDDLTVKQCTELKPAV